MRRNPIAPAFDDRRQRTAQLRVGVYQVADHRRRGAAPFGAIAMFGVEIVAHVSRQPFQPLHIALPRHRCLADVGERLLEHLEVHGALGAEMGVTGSGTALENRGFVVKINRLIRF